MGRTSVADAIRQAWDSKRIEVIAGVCDGLRVEHGFNYVQIHAMFQQVLDIEISLPVWDAIMYAADEGVTGEIAEIRIQRPPEKPDGRTP